MSNYNLWRKQLYGIAALDFHLAKKVCEWIQPGDALLFHSILATSEALQDGHSCLLLSAVAGKTLWFSSLPDYAGYQFPELPELLASLEKAPLAPENQSPLVLENRRLYLRRYWIFENELAEAIAILATRPHAAPIKNLRESLDLLFPNSNDNQIDWQKVASGNALLSGLQVISGGPGTGKTYTVARLLAALINCSRNAPKICLAAPTGKAAQRLGESIKSVKIQLQGSMDFATLDAIPDTAITLHRLLGVIPGSPKFTKNATNPLELDVLIVDEVSMVDLPLMTRLFRALPEQARVILLGDANQLPSVAAGSVLADLVTFPHPGYSKQRKNQLHKLGISLAERAVKNSHDHVSFLHRSRRFSDTSQIGKLAKEVLQGEVDASWKRLVHEPAISSSAEKFKPGAAELSVITDSESDRAVQYWIKNYYSPMLQAQSVTAAFGCLQQFRMLCATRVGPRGSLALNDMVERRLCPANQKYYQGKAVIITANNYDVNLSNGDVGIVWPDEKNRLLAWFETADGLRPVAIGRLPAHEAVFAMTIHKTQGSEFEHVAMVLPEQPNRITSRELIFTGLTRAKQSLAVVTSEATWRDSIARRVERYSGLSQRLMGRLKANR